MTHISAALSLFILVWCIMHQLHCSVFICFICSQCALAHCSLSAKSFHIMSLLKKKQQQKKTHVYSIAAFLAYLLASESLSPAEESHRQRQAHWRHYGGHPVWYRPSHCVMRIPDSSDHLPNFQEPPTALKKKKCHICVHPMWPNTDAFYFKFKVIKCTYFEFSFKWLKIMVLGASF